MLKIMYTRTNYNLLINCKLYLYNVYITACYSQT